MTTLKNLLIAVFFGLSLAACEQDGPAEEFGESVDEVGDEVSDAADEVGDEIDESM